MKDSLINKKYEGGQLKGPLSKIVHSLFETRAALLGKYNDQGPDDLSPFRADDLDFAIAQSIQLMGIRIRDRRNRTLGRVDNALFRIRNGDYGKCSSCDEKIDPSRLMAVPTTDRCILCKESEERVARGYCDRTFKN